MLGAAYLSKPLATNNLNVGTYNFDTTVEEGGVGTMDTSWKWDG